MVREWLPNSEYDIDSAKYVKFTKGFESQFIKTGSQLMTKINNYLNEKIAKNNANF